MDRKPYRAVVFFCGLAGAGAAGLALFTWQFWPLFSPYAHQVFAFFQDKEKLHQWLAAQGSWAPLAFIVLQIVKVVIPPIPGVATGVLGGYLFGLPAGFFYSTLGLTIGCLLAFLGARWFQGFVLGKLLRREVLEKFAFLNHHTSLLVLFLVFLIPGIPKDYFCYILGLSRMPLRAFIAIAATARMPGTFLLTLQGAEIYQGNYWAAGVIWVLIILMALLSLRYRERFYGWVQRLGVPGRGAAS